MSSIVRLASGLPFIAINTEQPQKSIVSSKKAEILAILRKERVAIIFLTRKVLVSLRRSGFFVEMALSLWQEKNPRQGRFYDWRRKGALSPEPRGVSGELLHRQRCRFLLQLALFRAERLT